MRAGCGVRPALRSARRTDAPTHPLRQTQRVPAGIGSHQDALCPPTLPCPGETALLATPSRARFPTPRVHRQVDRRDVTEPGVVTINAVLCNAAPAPSLDAARLGYRLGMPDDPLDDYLATLRAATRPDTPEPDPGDLMDAIAQATDDAQWRDLSTATSS
jgi:hypothetical protein